ncbi:hypothetical protein G9A89_018300 [Geosiphon pyriformis]|nr:hypothetical protein G9A89_018300 [Geosiphon pyriformis]
MPILCHDTAILLSSSARNYILLVELMEKKSLVIFFPLIFPQTTLPNLDVTGSSASGIIWATTVVTSDKRIIILSGLTNKKSSTNSQSYTHNENIFEFQLQSENPQWGVSDIKPCSPYIRRRFPLVIDAGEYIYCFRTPQKEPDTLDEQFRNSKNIIFYNEKQNWFYVQPPYGQLFNLQSFYDHTATFLKDNNRIVFIGGKYSMNEIHIFNINNSTWKKQEIRGNYKPKNRGGHTAVLASDERIIVYGGNSDQELSDPLVILDTKNWTWTKISVKSQPIPVPFYHTATMFKNYMIIAFGIEKESGRTNVSQKITILNTNDGNFEWLMRSDNNSEGFAESPGDPKLGSQKNDQQAKLGSNKKSKAIVGGTISGLVFLGLIAGIGLFLYRNKRSQGTKISQIHQDTLVKPRTLSSPPYLPPLPRVSAFIPDKPEGLNSLNPSLTNLHISDFPSVQSRPPLDSSSAPILFQIPLFGSKSSFPLT